MALKKELTDFTKRVKAYVETHVGDLEAVATMMIQEADFMNIRFTEIKKLLDIIDPRTIGLTDGEFKSLPGVLKTVYYGNNASKEETAEFDAMMEEVMSDSNGCFFGNFARNSMSKSNKHSKDLSAVIRQIEDFD